MKSSGKRQPRRSPVGRRLGQQWLKFLDRVEELFDAEDPNRMEAAVAQFRRHVERAAEAGVETSVTWHSLGMWTWDRPARLTCFARALACLEREEAQTPPDDAHERWSYAHYRAKCLLEMALVHAAEGRRKDARQCLAQALPAARLAEDLQPQNDPAVENLEGRIAIELLLL